MIGILTLLLLATLALGSIALLKAYRQVPERELRRRAREGDETAKRMYQAVAYGHSLTTLMWLVVGFTNAAFFIYVARSMSTLFALAFSASLIWAAYVLLPARRVTGVSVWAATQLAPAFAGVLNYLHPAIDRVSGFMARHWPAVVHTGLFDRDDLLEMLHYQKTQADSRIDVSEIDIAMHALSFSDRKVGEIMVPRKQVQMISAKETVGPVLMNELHQHGYSQLLVYEGKKDNVVGVLNVQDLAGARQGGSASEFVKNQLYYINEEHSLADALRAVLKTKQHMYVVVNSFEEFVGITTAQDVLRQLVGAPSEGFDQYDDRHAVASWEPQPVLEEIPIEQPPTEEPVEQPAPDLARMAVSSTTGIEQQPTEEATEVIE